MSAVHIDPLDPPVGEWYCCGERQMSEATDFDQALAELLMAASVIGPFALAGSPGPIEQHLRRLALELLGIRPPRPTSPTSTRPNHPRRLPLPNLPTHDGLIPRLPV